MQIEIAIVNYNTDFYLHNLLVSIRSVLPGTCFRTVHVWDNGSTDRSQGLLRGFGADVPWLSAHHASENIHHGAALDTLLRDKCTADWVLLLDSDTEVRRDFLEELRLDTTEPPAFIGQIHPQMPHLYAYLAHLLVHRPQYLDLPPFRHHGAPGIDYFKAIEDLQVPYRRFRWCDYVMHFGQGTLREIHARGETSNELYGFAAKESLAAPLSPARDKHIAELRKQLDVYLDVAGQSTGLQQRRAPTSHDGHEPSTTADRSPRTGPRPDTTIGPSAQVHARAASRRARLSSLGHVLRAPRIELAIGRARRIGLVQKRQEIRQLARIVRALEPARLLEIGTAHGGSLYVWTRVAHPSASLISLDLAPWEPEDPWEAVVVERLRQFARRRQQVHVLRMNSHRPEARAAVAEILAGHRLDFLFVDGDPSYDGVKQDVLDYAPLVRPGGLVALHDIHHHSRGWGGDVPRVWKEIADGRRRLEIIEDAAQDGFGVGLLWM